MAGSRGRAWPLVASAIALAARLAFLNGKSIWVDESYALALVHEAPLRLIILAGTGTPHPPFAFLLAWLSSHLFGAGEAGGRMLFALAGALAALPLFRFCERRAGTPGAMIASLTWAVCPMAVSLGQEAWVYGPLALWSFLALDTADLAWRGSKWALAGFILACAGGFSTQHLFLLPALASLGLYFTVEREKRAGWERPAAGAVVIALMYAPLYALFSHQFRLRSARMASAGIAAGLPSRLSRSAPGVFSQLLAGGVFPSPGSGLLARPRMMAAMIALSATQVVVLISALADRRSPASLRVWVALTFAAPFGIFIFDDPGVRQFSTSWAAFAVALALASRRRLVLGLVPLAASALLLLPYYSIHSFPYHRSDWRSAVQDIQHMSEAGDAAVVTGSKSAAQAWGFYSNGSIPVAFPEGGNPYLAEDREPRQSDPARKLDSLLAGHRRVWLVRDYWGGPPLDSLVRTGRIVFRHTWGETLEAVLVARIQP